MKRLPRETDGNRGKLLLQKVLQGHAAALPAVPGFLPPLLWFQRMLTSHTAALFCIKNFEISPRTKTFGPSVFSRTLDEGKFT